MGRREENRRGVRIKTRFETLVACDEEHGAGVLADISYCGALLTGTSVKPPLGAAVRLYVFLQPVCPFELVGRVTRHTENGFAVEYEKPDPDVQRLVDDAAAMVAIPSA